MARAGGRRPAGAHEASQRLRDGPQFACIVCRNQAKGPAERWFRWAFAIQTSDTGLYANNPSMTFPFRTIITGRPVFVSYSFVTSIPRSRLSPVIRGGSVYGASDAISAYVKDKPVTPEDFGATLFDALGIPPATRYGRDGFSEQVSAGQPIRALFA